MAIKTELETRKPHSRIRTREELDGLVVNMELTLISIIQGVALYFLTDSARMPVLAGQLSALPYIFTGLLIILLFWSRSLIHTLVYVSISQVFCPC